MGRTADVRERSSRAFGVLVVRALAFGCALLLAMAFGCGGEMKPVVGSETHFLTLCEDDSCPDGSACVCGVCTKTCRVDDECKGLSSMVLVAGGDPPRSVSAMPKLCGHRTCPGGRA